MQLGMKGNSGNHTEENEVMGMAGKWRPTAGLSILSDLLISLMFLKEVAQKKKNNCL